MSEAQKWYIAFRYSGIQQALLRHQRLWSISGTSELMNEINEVILPAIVNKHDGRVLMAGGGKLTALFYDSRKAEKAKNEIIEAVATNMPFIEFQIYGPLQSDSVSDALYRKDGLLNGLAEQKRAFRGYGITYNPHFKICEECSQYPAEDRLYFRESKNICFICKSLYEKTAELPEDSISLSGLKRLQKNYIDHIKREATIKGELKFSRNFEDLFSPSEKKKRIALWMSDVNNMGKRVPLWFKQDDDKVYETFNKVKEVYFQIILNSLLKTFTHHTLIHDKKAGEVFTPFRIILAGGDDLCIIMNSRHILTFAEKFNESFKEMEEAIKKELGHPLNESWFRKYSAENIPPYSVGSSFIIADLHTPFSKIFELTKDRLKVAKDFSREANTVNWDIYYGSTSIMKFHKPLYFFSRNGEYGFLDYLNLARRYEGLSASKIYYLARCLEKYFLSSESESDKKELLLDFISLPDASRKSSLFRKLLKEERFLFEDGYPVPERWATFLEILTIYQESKEQDGTDASMVD